jgi:predicted DNA-binding WGR domain protein
MQYARERLHAMYEKGYRETEISRSRRAFEFRSGNRQKFWIIQLLGDAYEVHFGRIPKNLRHGYGGQRKVKHFQDAGKARTAYEKHIAKKLQEGYTENLYNVDN